MRSIDAIVVGGGPAGSAAAGCLKAAGIAVIVLDKDGKIFSRMAGFVPERFEDMLTQRIEEARH